MSRNKRLKACLDHVSKLTADARSDDAWPDVFAPLKEFQQQHGAIKFNHTAHWWIAGVTSLITAVFFYVSYTSHSLMRDMDIWWFVVATILVCVAAAPLFMISSNNDEINSLSRRIFNKDVRFDNFLTQLSIPNESLQYKVFANEFGEFHRGGEKYRITNMVSGQYEGEEHSFSFTHYRFDYVTVIYVPVKVGKVTTMQRREIPHTRYGIIMPFADFTAPIAITSDGGSYDSLNRHYKPSSIDFNDRFTVRTNDEQAAARFLQPNIVLELIELDNAFSGLNLQVSAAGNICISFADDNVLTHSREHGIDAPEQFEAELRKHFTLPRLQRLNAFVHELMKYND